MPPVNRKNPIRATSSESQYSLMEFMKDFPDDDSCLNWLWKTRHSENGTHAECPKCKDVKVFNRYKTTQSRQSWTCTACGHHLHPTAGTIFHKSSTSLHLWFYAMYLMTSTRCGISAKQIERELGVTYKTAWRMLNLIRNQLMEQDGQLLSGEVEADETFIGGRVRAGENQEQREARERRRQRVLGVVERGGPVRVTIIDRKRRAPRVGAQIDYHMTRYVLPESMIFTDDYKGYTDRMSRQFGRTGGSTTRSGSTSRGTSTRTRS